MALDLRILGQGQGSLGFQGFMELTVWAGGRSVSQSSHHSGAHFFVNRADFPDVESTRGAVIWHGSFFFFERVALAWSVYEFWWPFRIIDKLCFYHFRFSHHFHDFSSSSIISYHFHDCIMSIIHFDDFPHFLSSLITYLTSAVFLLAAWVFGFVASWLSGFFDFWLRGFSLSVLS